jgi:hypothetical protein
VAHVVHPEPAAADVQAHVAAASLDAAQLADRLDDSREHR